MRTARAVSLRIPSHHRCMALSTPADQLTLKGSNTIGRLCYKSPTAADARAYSLYGACSSHCFRGKFGGKKSGAIWKPAPLFVVNSVTA